MQCLTFTQNKIHTIESIDPLIKQLQWAGKKVVFTNGCFDIIHQGHLTSLHTAAQYGNFLIVGINSDASVQRLKGPTRPINDTHSRALVMANLMMVDAVIVFDQDTPLELITAIMPNVLVKGGDYTIDQIVGAKEVIANGGSVKIVPIVAGFSTTSIIEKMK
jgi:D-glycero-beta-D-manno-heptose 1-phosphate adenylyltransferase